MIEQEPGNPKKTKNNNVYLDYKPFKANEMTVEEITYLKELNIDSDTESGKSNKWHELMGHSLSSKSKLNVYQND